MAKSDRVGTVLLIIGLALAALGQFYFTYRRQYVWDGVLFWVGGVVALSLVLRRMRRLRHGESAGRRDPISRWLTSLDDHRVRTLMAVGGVCLSFAAGWLARERPPDAGFVDLLVVWLIGVASFLLAFLPIPPLRDLSAGPGELGCWLRRNGALLVGLALLVLFALLVRGYDLEHIPANLGGDEGTQGADALQLLRPALGNPFSTGWYSVPTMSFLAYGMSMEVFGATVSGLRALSAVVGAATVLTTFLLARELWGPRAAWLSGAALALSHYHIHFSRLGSNQIADGLFITSSLWLLMRGLRTRRASTFAAAGAAVGLGWYGYFGARLVVVVVVCYLAWQAMVRHRFLDRYGHLLVIMVASAAVVAAPLLLHYVAHPGDLVSRPRQVSIFASEWLAREREVTGRSSVSLLFEQFWKSISAFNYTLDPTFWYRASIPLLDSVSGLFFILGMTWAMRRYRWPSSSLLVIWFWLALILGWVTTENPPSSQRMVIVAPALALFVGLGVDQLFRLLRRLLEGQQTVYLGLAMGLLVAVAGLNLRYYFLVYTPTRVYGNPTAEMTTVLARQLEERGGDHVVYFHGPPYVYWDFGTLRFMARDVMGIDVPPPQEGEAPQPDLGRGARFVLHPRRLDELEGIQARYPGGRTEYVHSTADGELLYAMYEVRR